MKATRNGSLDVTIAREEANADTISFAAFSNNSGFGSRQKSLHTTSLLVRQAILTVRSTTLGQISMIARSNARTMGSRRL